MVLRRSQKASPRPWNHVAQYIGHLPRHGHIKSSQMFPGMSRQDSDVEPSLQIVTFILRKTSTLPQHEGILEVANVSAWVEGGEAPPSQHEYSPVSE